MKALLLLFFSLISTESTTLSELKNSLKKNDDKLYILNFWATWCKPCVEEMAHFDSIAIANSSSGVELIFVSLNQRKEQKIVERFIERRGIQSKVIILNEQNANSWINEVDSSWSGSIPATLFYKNGKKLFFYEGEINAELLEEKINLYTHKK